MAVNEVSFHGPKVIYRFTGIWKWVFRWWKRPFWFSKKIYVTFTSNWMFPYQGGCSQTLFLPKIFLFHLRLGNMKFPLLCSVNTSFALSLLAWSSDAPSPQFFNVCFHNVSFPDSPSLCITEKYTWQDFSSKLMQSRLVFRRNRVTFDHCSKRYYWSVKRHSEPPFTWCLPIRQEILNVSQIGIAFQRFRPPFVT